MSTTFKFYADPGLTTELVAGGATIVSPSPATDRLIYFGSVASGKTLQAASDPGSDPITISSADASVGDGIEASAIVLSLSALGLDSATPGDPINLGTSISSGTGNAIPVYVRTLRGSLGVGSYGGLSLTTNAIVES